MEIEQQLLSVLTRISDTQTMLAEQQAVQANSLTQISALLLKNTEQLRSLTEALNKSSHSAPQEEMLNRLLRPLAGALNELTRKLPEPPR